MLSKHVGDADTEDGAVTERGLLTSGSSTSIAQADSLGSGHADVLLAMLARLARSGREWAGWVAKNDGKGACVGVDMLEGPGGSDWAGWEDVQDG